MARMACGSGASALSHCDVSAEKLRYVGRELMKKSASLPSSLISATIPTLRLRSIVITEAPEFIVLSLNNFLSGLRWLGKRTSGHHEDRGE